MTDDPIVAAVRAVREELARESNYDVARIFAEMRQRENAHGPRLVRQRPGKLGERAPVTARGE
jgi:hypothetical protein